VQSPSGLAISNVVRSMTNEEVVKSLLKARIRLAAIVWPLLRDAHTASDIFQEMMLKAVANVEKFQCEDHLLNWARVTARHLAIDHIRKESKFASLQVDLLEVFENDLLGVSDDDLEGQLDALMKCVERLPDRSRRIVDLRYHQGVACGEIAERLKSTVDAVYQALRRIHVALKECVEQSERRSSI